MEGAKERYGADARAARARAHRVRARRHQVDGVLRVLPRRLGPRALREVARHPGRSGAGERGRFVRRVLPAHRRHRPDQVRPAVRAVPQPGPQADARHRHGLRLALPRRDDPVRRAEVRRTTTSRRSITFSTIKARAAVRDAARVLGYPYARRRQDRQAHAAARSWAATRRCTRASSRTTSTPTATRWPTELRAALRRRSRRAAASIDVALGLEGLRRQDGIHAAAVVITREPLTEYLPIQRKPEPGTPIEEAPMVTQYEMHGVEELGLLKMDFLGLRNLDVMEIALDLIEAVDRRRGPTSTTLAARRRRRRSSCCGGPTRSACSSSRAARCARCCARSRPTTFEDVAAVVALYRPGPMAQNWHNEYADRKNGRKPVTLRPPRPRGDPRPDLRADDLPRAADARRRRSSRATRSKRPTTCARRPARRSAS